MGVRELSRALDMPVGSTHRVLQALKRERLVTYLPDPLAREIVRTGARAAAPHRLEDPEQLLRQLPGIRRRGYAVSHGEREEGLSSVAAAIHGPEQNVLASVALYGPNSRF